MAVIIPMAKMPNNCEECDLKGLCPDYWTKTREEYTRPSWCQLDDLDATTFCGVPMEEAVEIMQMYRRGELVHLAGRKTEPQYHADVECNYKDCDNCGHKEYCPQSKTGPQTETTNGLQLFADILFNKDKTAQFLEECKTIGIEP